MSPEPHQSNYSAEQLEAEELSNLRLRSRTSTATSNSKTDQTSVVGQTNSSLPSPVIAPQTVAPKAQRGSRGGSRKSNKSTRRSSLNQKKEPKKKVESGNSPPSLPNNPPQKQEIVPEEEDANITRCAISKSSAQQPSRRSPSFTSSSSRRERVNPDAASLAAFLTDAGVKPEDQLSLGGFALPTFAQTRRQSNMLVDGVVQLSQKKHPVIDTSCSSTTESALPSAIPDFHKTKRKRPSLDLLDSPTLQNTEPTLEEKLKRPRISPVADLPSPAASVSTTTSKLHNPPSASSLFSGPIGKQKRSRKVGAADDPGVATSNSKNKAAGVFAGRNPVSASSTASGRRGSPTKRSREDGRRTKQQHQQVTEQQQAQQQQQQRQQQVEAMLSEGWGLPDHLSYLDYLLPSAFPQPLVIEGLSTDQNGSLSETNNKIYETPAKVKFPSKRTTIADLRKRSKHLVDYLQKVQIESSDREKRNELIAKSLRSQNQNQQHSLNNDNHPTQLVDSSSLHNSDSFSSVHSVVSPKTLEIIDDLSRQLYHWQEKFKQN
ncbi:hypothetical protein H4Q26_012372 [Puccinia striiformis f. sp. tritici PST-130]|nr:hypothetical protein H4Q26_012372 [Puccinia striiformis f. sp. tritici PST-130]